METATQTLHRLTSYEPGREWDEPVDDPRVVQDLEVNDLARFPWFYKRYAQPLPRVPLPRDLPATTAPAVAVLAGTADVRARGRWTCRTCPGCCTCPRAWCARRSGRTRPGCSAPPGPRAAASRSSCTSPCRRARRCPPGVHWYHPQDHALVQVGPPPRGAAPAIVVTGVPWRTGWRYRERGYRHVYWDAGTMLAQLLAVGRLGRARRARCTPASRTRRSPRSSARTGCTSGPSPSSRSATARPRSRRPARRPRARSTRPRSSSRSSRPRSGRATATRSARRGTAAPRSTCRSPGRDPVETVVLARGSQRRMDPTRGLCRRTCCARP